jgi:hypothetical protein
MFFSKDVSNRNHDNHGRKKESEGMRPGLGDIAVLIILIGMIFLVIRAYLKDRPKSVNAKSTELSAQQVLVTLRNEDWEKIDVLCKNVGLSRNEYILRVIIRHLQELTSVTRYEINQYLNKDDRLP